MAKQPIAQTRRSGKIILIRNAYAFDTGGAEKYPTILGEQLKKHGLEPIVVSRHKGVLSLANRNALETRRGWWWRHQNWSGWRALLFPIYFLWQILLAFWYIQLFLRLGPYAVHVQSRDDFIAASLAGRLLGKRVIWTDHADLKYVFMNHYTWYKNPVGKLVYLISRSVFKIIVVSKNELSLINNALGEQRLRNTELIYNGVADMPVKPIRDFDAKTTVFAASSRLVTTKGIGELIEASRLLDAGGYSHRVVLLGEGPEEHEFKTIAGKSIVFMGFLENALSYVAGADIFVHPTYNEAFSISLVEAAMLGMPVITTEVGGNPEIIFDKETGILVEAKNADELYKAMRFAIDNPEIMKKHGKNLRVLYEKNFQFDAIVKHQIIPLYNGKA